MGILGGNRFFSADYGTSRHRFRRLADQAGAIQESVPFDGVGPDGEELTLDLAWLGTDSPRRAVVVSSGLHGVEGYLGAAVQLALLEAPPTLPDDVALVLLHALNPYGFAWSRRVDAENIDLNRNFMCSGEDWSGAPAGYAELDDMLNPPSAPGRGSAGAFLARAGLAVARSGMGELKNVVAGGQYTHPHGLFFGGHGPSATMQVLAERVPGWFEGCEQVDWIDVHTGLGRSATYKLLVDHASDSPEVGALVERFGRDVQGWQKDGVAYTIRGGLGTWVRSVLPEARAEVLAAEFGTRPVMSVITALHLENRAHHHGDPASAVYRAAKERMRETFAPSDPGWRDATLDKAHRVVLQALAD